MTDALRAPTVAGELGELKRRVFDLERSPITEPEYRFEVCATGWGMSGGYTSTPWRPRGDCQLVQVAVDLYTTEGADTHWQVWNASVLVGTAVVPAGETYAELALTPAVGCYPAQRLWVVSSDTIAGSNGATVHLVFTARRPFICSGGLVFGNPVIGG